jgi:hypothetical protein
LQPLAPAEAELRKAAALQSGWYSIRWSPDTFYTGVNVNHVQEVRQVATYLRFAATLHSEDEEHDDAVRSSLMIVALARSFGEEPTLISSLVRMAIRSVAVISLEECLARGTVSDSLLAEAQKQLAAEAKHNVFLYGMRGERAMIDSFMTNAEAGKADPIPLLAGKRKSWGDSVLQVYFTKARLMEEHAWILRFYNDLVESARLPPAEMRAKRPEIDRKAAAAPLLAKMLVPAVARVGESAIRSQVMLECAIAAIGVERYRLQNGRWPDSLDEVVAAKFLDKVPTDHFDGKPLRYRKASDGVVIYSVGKAGNYKGDALDPGSEFDPNTTERYEFRLWDVEHRRQPPRSK